MDIQTQEANDQSVGSTLLPGQTANSLKVYLMAKQCLGKHLCENSAYGCAETVNAIVDAALGYPAGGSASTYLMYNVLKSSPRFEQVTTPLPGDIIISPTGYGTNPIMPNGHVGIVGIYGILSNDSYNGLLEENYTLAMWKDHYNGVGGYPIYYFRAL